MSEPLQRWFGISYAFRLGNQILSVLKQAGIWIRSKFYVELYRGQITATTRILSPAARHGNGVPSSKAEFKYLRTQAKLGEIIIASSRGELPTTSPFVYVPKLADTPRSLLYLKEE